jgi:hypothetical protein
VDGVEEFEWILEGSKREEGTFVKDICSQIFWGWG